MNTVNRTSDLELPDANEVLDLIMNKESRRIGSKNDWVQTHREVFRPIRELADLYAARDMLDVNLQITTKEQLAQAIAETEAAKQELVQKLLQDSSGSALKQQVFEALSVTDEPATSDAIFVFGAQSNARIDMAVELFHGGYAPKIVISGQGPNWKVDIDQTEAERMKERAIEQGVPPENIIIETKALTIPDNVKRTLDLFDQINFHPKRIIIVASLWVLLRCTIDWHRFPSEPIEVIRIAPPLVDPMMAADKWHTHEKGINLILNEYAKIIHEVTTNSYLRSLSDDSEK